MTHADGSNRATAPVDATAGVVTGAEYSDIHDKVKTKYGIMTSFTKFLGKVGGLFKGKQVPYGDCGVVITMAG